PLRPDGEAAPDWLLRGELPPPRGGGLTAPEAVAPPAGVPLPADPGAPPVGTAERGADGSRTIESTAAPTGPSVSNETAASSVPTSPSALPASGASSVAGHSRQVPPEVAHYMAYMDRQSTSQAPSPASHAAPPAQQPGQSQKSRLLLIAAVIGGLALAMLAGLSYVVFRLQQGQRTAGGQGTPAGPNHPQCRTPQTTAQTHAP